MKIVKHYIVSAPTEPPSIPNRFTLCHYECTGDGKEYKNGYLDLAAFHWFENGTADNFLRAMCESENLPAEQGETVGRTYLIYSDWNETTEDWFPWLDYYTSEPIDFAQIEKSFLQPESG